MTDKELVLRKLTVMIDHVARARRRRGNDLEALRASLDLQDALVMSLLVALQEATDIAFHVASDEGWGVPGSNADAFALLGTRGLLANELALALATTVRLRNRIAHGYATLDLERIFNELPAGLTHLEQFAEAMGAWLQRSP